MFKVGIVTAQQVVTGAGASGAGCRVRVQFPDLDQLQSWWLPVVQRGTHDDKDFWMPDIGEQVVVLMDQFYEDGAVLGAIYSTVDTVPAGMTPDKRHLTVKDGAVFEYDRAQHALTVTLPPGATLAVSVSASQGGTSQALSFDASGNIRLSAPGGDIMLVTSEHSDSVNTIIDNYNAHVHPGVQSGGSDTGAPTVQDP